MVSIIRAYRCEKCRKRYQTFREAEDCELDHIVKDSVAGFKADLSQILGGPPYCDDPSCPMHLTPHGHSQKGGDHAS